MDSHLTQGSLPLQVDLDVMAVLKVAEEIASRWERSYLCLADGLKDAEGETCRGLAAYRHSLARRLEHIRTALESRGMARKAFAESLPGGDVRVLASLAFFAKGQRYGQSLRRPTTAKEILQQAGGRSQDALVFYQGLKGFTRDHNAHIVLDRLIERERRHWCAIVARLESERGAPHSDPGGLVTSCERIADRAERTESKKDNATQRENPLR